MAARIEDSVRKLYEAIQKQKEVADYVQAVKQKEYLSISNWMFSNLKKGTEQFEVRLDDGEKYYTNPINLKVTRIRRKTLVWDLDMLRTVLGRTRYENVVNKTYTINNMSGLVAYLKTCGVDPKKFKQFIDVEQKLDEMKMDTLLEKGEITETEIKNCYHVEVGDPYFRLNEMKS